uniref:Uncharacterized protein n=1 Tax=Falco tinnunculus TaxID=100819 RepID=A0A8C4UIB8_FALTI
FLPSSSKAEAVQENRIAVQSAGCVYTKAIALTLHTALMSRLQYINICSYVFKQNKVKWSRCFPLYIILFSLWLFLRKIGFCFTYPPFFFTSSPSFPPVVVCLHLSLHLWLTSSLTCCVIVFEASVTLPMVLVSPTSRPFPRMSLRLLVAPCSLCAPVVHLCPFHPMVCTLLKGFPQPLSGFSLRSPSRP